MSRLRFFTAGESHGEYLTGIIEGLPSGIPISAERIALEMRRRKMGYGRGNRQKIEDDALQIVSGIRFGKTLGSPISVLLKNKDWENWSHILSVFGPPHGEPVSVPRPGHADYPGAVKYAHQDIRNVLERASARETAMRVALGSLAKEFLDSCGIFIASHVVSIGDVKSDTSDIFAKNPGFTKKINSTADLSPVRCLQEEISKKMTEKIDAAKKAGDTLGGVFEVLAEGVPLGLGSHVHWDRRLEGLIAQHFMSLNAIKGVEIGMGFLSADLPGSQVHDEFFPPEKNGKIQFKTNRCGGILGGMTTGEPLIVRAAMKPIATLMSPLQSVDLNTYQPKEAHIERSDTCAVPAASVIAESLLALVLADAILEKFGGDSLDEIVERIRD